MGAFDDLKNTKNQGFSGGSAALPASAPVAVGECTIKENKRRKKGESGRKKGGAASPADIVAGAGDIITASGIDANLLPASVDDVTRLLPLWVSAWCSDNDVSDVRKVSPLVFRSLCSYIGIHIKHSRILKDNTIRTGAGVGRSACNAFEPSRVLALFDVFKVFCDSCDKIPFSSTFAAFAGVSLSYVREYGDTLTSIGLDMRKKTHDAEIDAIRQKTSSDPVGRLAILNNEHYNNGFGASGASDRVAVSLPSGGAFGLIESKKVD